MCKRRDLQALATSSVTGKRAKFTNTDAVGSLDLTEDAFLLYYFYFVSHVRNEVRKAERGDSIHLF